MLSGYHWILQSAFQYLRCPLQMDSGSTDEDTRFIEPPCQRMLVACTDCLRVSASSGNLLRREAAVVG